MRVEVGVSSPKPPELHSETSVCHSVFQSHPGVFAGVFLPDAPRDHCHFGNKVVESAQ